MNDDLKKESCDFELDGEAAFTLATLIVMRLRDAIMGGGPDCPIPDEWRDMVGGTLTLAADHILEVAASWGAVDGITAKLIEKALR